MISIKLSTEGLRIANRIDNAKNFLMTGLRKGFKEVGKNLTFTAKEGIKNPPKTGRFYRYKNRMIQASAPGEYPAKRSGTLMRGVGFTHLFDDAIRFGATPTYAGYLEKGTRKMKKRPFLDLSIKKDLDKNSKALGNAIQAEIERRFGK